MYVPVQRPTSRGGGSTAFCTAPQHRSNQKLISIHTFFFFLFIRRIGYSEHANKLKRC
jgi:hypothetical protein